jgi:hypothetical protein
MEVCRMLTTGEEWLPGEVIIIPLLSFLFLERVVVTRTIHTFIVLNAPEIYSNGVA